MKRIILFVSIISVLCTTASANDGEKICEQFVNDRMFSTAVPLPYPGRSLEQILKEIRSQKVVVKGEEKDLISKLTKIHSLAAGSDIQVLHLQQHRPITDKETTLGDQHVRFVPSMNLYVDHKLANQIAGTSFMPGLLLSSLLNATPFVVIDLSFVRVTQPGSSMGKVEDECLCYAIGPQKPNTFAPKMAFQCSEKTYLGVAD